MKIEIHHSKPLFCKKDPSFLNPIFESSQIASNGLVKKFESEFCGYIGSLGAVATNSGTSALHLSLLAMGINKGDEIIIPSYVCASILDAINYIGAKPALTDIDRGTFNISIKDAKRKITKRTKAIIIPHMFGLACDIDEFLGLGIPIIEDCAQSLGAKYKNRMVGSFGLVSIFSFYATKLITTGYGGMIVSNSKRLLAKIRDLNEPDKRQIYKLRYNYKMSELQAALGMSQFKYLRYFIKKRKEIAKAYNFAFSKYNLGLPAEKNNREHIFYRYVIMTKKAAFIKSHLEKKGIEIMPAVFKPLHRYLSMDKKNFPNTERVYRQAVSLPIYPALRKREVLKVISVLREAISR